MDQKETERKYTVAVDGPAEVTGTELTINLVEPLGWGDATFHELVADYVDTPDLDLVRSGYALRRREGGDDEGWHLKTPRRDETRVEVHRPLDAGRSAALVPLDLREQVADLVGLDALVPVAQLRTERHEHQILRVADGEVLAVLADDRVTATTPDGRSQAWREVEVELVGGTREDLAEIDGHLRSAGLVPSQSGSKVSQALGLDDAPGGRADEEAPATAGDVIVRHLRRQVGALQGLEGKTRSDAPDSVHKSRVATRRLRSTLKTFRDVLDRDVTDAIALEVRWLGEVLGAPRDAEVLKERILDELAQLPAEQVEGDIRERVEAALDQAHREAHEALVRALDSDRHATLMEALVGMLVAPPLLEEAQRKAGKELDKVSRRVSRKVERARRRAMAEDDHEHRLELLHEVRKKAKAARYAHEAFGDLGEGAARDLAKRWEEVTESLGELQDTVVTRERLREIAAGAALAGQPTGTYERLVEQEAERAHEALERAGRALDKLAAT